MRNAIFAMGEVWCRGRLSRLAALCVALGSALAPANAAIADDLGVAVHEVHKMEGRLTSRDVAFDSPLDDDDERSWQAPQYFLEDSQGDPAVEVESRDFQKNNETQLHAALSDLDDRSRDILAQRWLSEEKATLHELADIYGVSAERIRQLEKNAMKKLRTAIAEP